MKYCIKAMLFCISAWLLVICSPVYADELKEIPSITVLCDKRLSVPISQLATSFTQKNTISVSVVFGDSADQKKKIEDGEAADVFITAEPWILQQLKSKGMLDVYSIGVIAIQFPAKYSAAVVAGENMTSARKFLEYLRSNEAYAIFRQNNMDVP